MFQFDVPLTQLKPGTYICQVNVIDDAGGSFMFPRLALKVMAAGGECSCGGGGGSGGGEGGAAETICSTSK